MSDLIQELESVQKQIDKASADISKAEGRYEAGLKSLKDLGYDSIESGEAAYQEIESTLSVRIEKLKVDTASFFEEFNHVFGN